MAQFKLPSGHTSAAVAHHGVEELWYVVGGRGQMWRKHASTGEDTIELAPGVSLALLPGMHFQFRSTGADPLEVIGVTVPAWPGAEEAYAVEGRWPASVPDDREHDGC
jgi:mannose-6-phosphate isomerase-like protein (cupin superfamily)